jgi:hypothetical protein
MILAKDRLIDGQLSFERGVETLKAPSRVPRNQSALLVNATTRTSFIAPRPGWKQVPLIYADDEVENTFETGLFQGAGGYNPDTGESCLVLSISGHLYRVNVFGNGLVQEISLDEPNPSQRRQVWMCQAENFLVIQDGQSKPVIWSGASARRSDVTGSGGAIDGHPMVEIPVGTVMEYVNGRLWVALPNGRYFVAGDGVYGPTGTEKWGFRDSVLRFTENTFLNEGGAFAVPTNMGEISAMRAVANLDTSLGQGPLQVFTTEGCFSVNTPFDREIWKNLSYPIQTVSLLGQGAMAADSTVRVNGDIWFRSRDGVLPFLIARRNFGSWGNRTLSHEVEKHLRGDNKGLLRYGSATVFDNRLLVTVNPQFDRGHGTYHKGLVVLDFHPLTSIGENEAPSWEGLWTGLDILKILTLESEGVQRCFAIALGGGSTRRLQIWELTLSDRWNTAADGSQTRTTVIIESPKLDFGNRLEQKKLDGADLWVDQVAGNVGFNLFYRPDEYPCWFAWKNWSVCAKTERCASEIVDGCLTDLNLKPQFRARMSAQRPVDSCIPFTNSPSRIGFGFQYRLEITGYAELTSLRLLAQKMLESPFGACLPTDSACEELICCDEVNLATPLVGNNQNDVVVATSGSTVTSGGGGTPPTPPPTDGGGGGGTPPPEEDPEEPPVDPPAPPPEPPGIIPDHELLPITGTPPLGCPSQFFEGEWTSPELGSPNGDTHGIGVYGEPPGSLEAGVLTAWANSLWAQFEEYVSVNSLTVTAAQIVYSNQPGSYRRFEANQVFAHDAWFSIVGYSWILQIEWCSS